jgi:hypothetical protein
MQPRKGLLRLCVGVVALASWAAPRAMAQPIVANHTSTDITAIPLDAIQQAKDTLHIAYGHTSHGSQLMTAAWALNAFANGGGLGLSLPPDTLSVSFGDSGGASLDFRDGVMADDVGYYPQWYDETRRYLAHPEGADINVVMWAWCGQLSYWTPQEIQDNYLTPMALLEAGYPHVRFIYMTGHADGSGEEGTLHANNELIRSYCLANNKILYDFYDIELYDPDGVYYGDRHVTDACTYDFDGDGVASQTDETPESPPLPIPPDRNWAIDWQGGHTEGVDWFTCESAHSQPINANIKAYAAWYLFARMAGWDGGQPPAPSLSIEDASRSESDAGATTVAFTVRLEE